jgi:hypothetical protein
MKPFKEITSYLDSRHPVTDENKRRTTNLYDTQSHTHTHAKKHQQGGRDYGTRGTKAYSTPLDSSP